MYRLQLLGSPESLAISCNAFCESFQVLLQQIYYMGWFNNYAKNTPYKYDNKAGTYRTVLLLWETTILGGGWSPFITTSPQQDIQEDEKLS